MNDSDHFLSPKWIKEIENRREVKLDGNILGVVLNLVGLVRIGFFFLGFNPLLVNGDIGPTKISQYQCA